MIENVHLNLITDFKNAILKSTVFLCVSLHIFLLGGPILVILFYSKATACLKALFKFDRDRIVFELFIIMRIYLTIYSTTYVVQ